MDIESSWAKSTEHRLEMFLDQYLIKSTKANVRKATQKLLFSLFKKGNQIQRKKLMDLLHDRCANLIWMGKASFEFLQLLKKVFESTAQYIEEKQKIVKLIFQNFKTIHKEMATNKNHEFYSFAANLIHFGQSDFKPYLLQANGCLNCYGESQKGFENSRLDSIKDNYKILGDKIEIEFKRYYEVKDLLINIKNMNKFKNITISYLDLNKQYKKLGNYKSGEAIPPFEMIGSSLLFQFSCPMSKKGTYQCMYCGNAEDLSLICFSCARNLDINGQFKAIGGQQSKIKEQLCEDFDKLRIGIKSLQKFYYKVRQSQKMNIQFSVNELQTLYSKIMINLSLLNRNQPEYQINNNKKCFACNYYEALNIANFIKDITSIPNFSFSENQITFVKGQLKEWIHNTQIQSIKMQLIEAMAVFCVSKDLSIWKQFAISKDNSKETVDLYCKYIYILKNKNSDKVKNFMTDLSKVITSNDFLKHIQNKQKIKLFTFYFLESENLQNIDEFSKDTQIARLTQVQTNPLKPLISFTSKELFNIPIDSYVKAYLKVLPANMLPQASFNVLDSQFFNYISCEIPQIDISEFQKNLVSCPKPILRLDMYEALPTLIERASIKQAMKTMNKLFPQRKVWNMNIIEACNKFEKKISELNPEEQILTCLIGYHEQKEEMYLKRIHKLLVPERVNFIIRLDTPQEQIERVQMQYPYIPIRQIRSQDLQGDNIRALHQWVYSELVKLDQAMPLDIIVQKNIIDNLDLPIEVVYQHVAQNKSKKTIGNKVYEYFRVIYRIQGILGQPKQRSIGNPRDQKLQKCIQYSSNFLNRISQKSQTIGLDVIMEMLSDIEGGKAHQNKKILLFEILSTLSKNEGICKKIVQGHYGDHIINAAVRLMSFQNEKNAKITNFLLELSSRVIDEANKEMVNLRKGSTKQFRKISDNNIDIEGPTESEKKVRFVLEKFGECEQNFEKTGNMLYRNIANRLIKLLPFCTKDEYQSSNYLFNYFEIADWQNKSLKKKEPLLIFMQSLSESFKTLKTICKDNKVTEEILTTIISNVRGQNGEVDEKKLSNINPVIETGLLLLCSLVQGDYELQSHLFKEKIFHNIYEIAMILPKKAQELKMAKVPENCFKIVKYFGEGKLVDGNISNFITNKKKEQKQSLAPLKKKKWQKMKEKQLSSVKNNFNKMEDENQEKQILICSSCHDGYLKRKQILGFYIYLSKIQIPHPQQWWKNTRKIPSLTSSTYLTPIHFDCHNRAFEADQKIPRSQWDGALIRNSDVLCNGWVAFKGPSTNNDEFSRPEKKYFEKNKNGTYWNVINDLNALMTRLSTEFDFATESKGSSASHNCRYIPFLMGFASHMYYRFNDKKQLREGVDYLLENPPKKLSHFNLMLCVSLFSVSYEQFSKEYIKRMVKIILSASEKPNQFKQIKPHLVYLKLATQVYEIIHKNMKKEEIPKAVQGYIQENTVKVMEEFDNLSSNLKNKFLKASCIEDFAF